MKKLIFIFLAIASLHTFGQDPLALSQQTTTAIQTEQATLANQKLINQGQAVSITILNTRLTAANKTIDSCKAVIAKLTGPIVVTPPPVTTQPTGGTVVNIGDGKNGITIDGNKTKYPAGTNIVIKPGTYSGEITLQNLTHLTVTATGVILNGSALNLGALNTTTVTGFTIQNIKGDYLRFNSRLVNTTLDRLTISNCTGQLRVGYSVKWDGTDNTVQLLGLTLHTCVFDNVGTLYLDGSIGNGAVTNLVKNLTVSNCIFRNSDIGNLVDSRAVDGFQVFGNVVTNINKTNRDDTRLFMFVGNGDAYNNSFNNICGHSIAINPVSFSTTVRDTSHFHNNTTTNTARYSQFEMQQFSEQIIPGLTQSGDLIIDSNTATNINTEHYGFNGDIVDNYMGTAYNGIVDYAKVTVTNNTGQNWFPVPAPNVYWNLSPPTSSSGNIYIK